MQIHLGINSPSLMVSHPSVPGPWGNPFLRVKFMLFFRQRSKGQQILSAFVNSQLSPVQNNTPKRRVLGYTFRPSPSIPNGTKISVAQSLAGLKATNLGSSPAEPPKNWDQTGNNRKASGVPRQRNPPLLHSTDTYWAASRSQRLF